MIIQKYKVWMKIHFVCIYHFIRDIISCIGCRLLNVRKFHFHSKMNSQVVISTPIKNVQLIEALRHDI